MIFRQYYTQDPLVLKTEYLRQFKKYNWYGGYHLLPFYDTYNGNWFVHSEFVELYYSRDYKMAFVRLLRPGEWLGDTGVKGYLPVNGHLELRSKDRHHFESVYRKELRGQKNHNRGTVGLPTSYVISQG